MKEEIRIFDNKMKYFRKKLFIPGVYMLYY